MKSLVAAAVAACMLTPAVAMAQEEDDWEYGEDAAQNLSAAITRYDTGHAFVIQCRGGHLSVLVNGLAANDQDPVRLEVRRADGRGGRLTWGKEGDRGLRALLPMRSARLLRGGGVVSLRSVAGTPAIRAGFDLPATSSNLDRVLEACRVPLADERDLIPMFEGKIGTWDITALAGNPAVDDRSVWGESSCIVQPDLTLGDCRVDLTSVGGRRYGDRMIREMTGTLVEPHPGHDAVGTVAYQGSSMIVEAP